MRKGSVVNLKKHILRPRTQDQSSQSDLVSSVSLLAACLERAGSIEGCVEVSEHGNVVEQALISAMEAERRLAEQMERLAYLEHLAVTDELTGLLNRRGFQASLKQALALARRYDENGVLVYVDLDGFKPINDTYGHAAGDEVLRRVGRALVDNVRETDSVGRMGGDEFAVLLARTSWDDGLSRAEILDNVLNDTFVSWEGRMIAVRASLGIQVYGAHDEGDELLSRADDDMYKTKRMRSELDSRRTGTHARN